MDEAQSIIHPLHDIEKVNEEFSHALWNLQNKEDFEEKSGQAYDLLDQYSVEYGFDRFFSDSIIIRAAQLEADISLVLNILHSLEDIYKDFRTREHVYTNAPDHTRDRAETAEQVAQFILSISGEQDKRPKALPLMCGTGKSSSLSFVIRHAIQNNRGLIIVTDQVERMHSYIEKHPGENDELKRFLEENRKKVTILESGSTYKHAWKNRKKTPVLILTTQRYFNELNQDGLDSLFEWDDGKRDLIIFDEMPYMKCFDYIGNEQINIVLTALQNGIDDKDPEGKAWCVNQWRSFSKTIDDQLNAYYDVYRKQKRTYFVYTHPTRSITQNDRLFWFYVQKNRARMESEHKDAYRILLAIRKLVETPTLVNCESRSRQSRKLFIVATNNMNRIVDIPAKAIILDGTANLSPEYQQSGIETVPCDEFNRDLSNLTIRLVNIKATKDALTRYPWLTEGIERYLSEEMIFDERPTVFTYKNVEESFRNNFITAHFGDIKGRNIYQGASMIAQVGLNRYDESYYIALGLYRDAEKVRQIALITDPAEQGAAIDQILYENNRFSNIMNLVLAADIEQNLFRGSIRDAYRGTLYTYFVVYDFSSRDIAGLKSIIKKRYKDLHVKIEFVPEPDEIKEIRDHPWASERITRRKLVLEWVDIAREISPGRVFRIREMLTEISVNSSRKEAQMTSKQFQKMKEKYPEIKKLFDGMRIGNTQSYIIPG